MQFPVKYSGGVYLKQWINNVITMLHKTMDLLIIQTKKSLEVQPHGTSDLWTISHQPISHGLQVAILAMA